jgi:hypothetical protein
LALTGIRVLTQDFGHKSKLKFRLLAAEILPNVTDQKIFFLKENDLEKGWYVIFVQIILECSQEKAK